MYFVYMVKNKYEDLYVGITDNPVRRLKEHNSSRGAKYTKRENVFNIVFLEEYPKYLDARKREIQIKKWRREKKENLIDLYNKNQKTRM